MPGSTLELFDDAGHFRHLDDPLRFARTLEAFFHASEPARLDTDVMRELMLAHDPHSAAVLERLRREHRLPDRAARQPAASAAWRLGSAHRELSAERERRDERDAIASHPD